MSHTQLLSYQDALYRALSRAEVKNNSEIVMLERALFRVISKDIICQKNLPSFDNSAMDGFAFCYEDRGKTLQIHSKIFAGDRPIATLKDNQCYKIMTGAQVPSDVDTIAPIEMCDNVSDTSVTIPENIKQYSALRRKGEEQKEGALLFSKGTLLTPEAICMLSAQGVVAVSVFEKISIAIISTGDEIKEPWQIADEDEIYNANGYGLKALFEKYHFSPSYIGSIPDNLQECTEFISTLQSYDVVITSGGISMGDADFLAQAFENNGLETLFHGVNIKPGKPTMMGVMKNSFVMALPGNPLTTLLNAFILSLPVLRKIQGYKNFHTPFLYAQSKQDLKLKSGRTNVALISMDEEAKLEFTGNNKYGSGMITPLLHSDGVALFDEHISSVGIDEWVKYIPFDSFKTQTNSCVLNS